MKPDDIEILDDFLGVQAPNNQNVNKNLESASSSNFEENFVDDKIKEETQAKNPWNSAPETSSKVIPAFEPVSKPKPIESVSEFEKMVNEVASNEATPNVAPEKQATPVEVTPVAEVKPNNQSYDNGFDGNDYIPDANNDLVQSNYQEPKSNEQDLTITAVYPNGLAVDKNEEIENTQVIMPKKKSRGDLPLIIIVAVLAITLVVLLIIFYL